MCWLVPSATGAKKIGRTDQEPLTPAVFHILLGLADGPLYGYAVMQAVGRGGWTRAPHRAGHLLPEDGALLQKP